MQCKKEFGAIFAGSVSQLYSDRGWRAVSCQRSEAKLAFVMTLAVSVWSATRESVGIGTRAGTMVEAVYATTEL